MHVLLIVGVTLLTAGAPGQARPAGLSATQPLHITFVRGSFEDAISTIAKVSGVVIELDQSVTADIRTEPLTVEGPLRLNGASVEETIDTLTRIKGLAFSILDTNTVRIFKKA
jgi:hypothetical protein